jgi:ParB/RepB/Spo0J family partition protein
MGTATIARLASCQRCGHSFTSTERELDNCPRCEDGQILWGGALLLPLHQPTGRTAGEKGNTMSTTSTIEAPQVQMIPTTKIVQVAGMNPRGSFSHDDPEFLQLKASIEERGIETPIKVGPAEIESGDEMLHPVIWGNRRHAAALEAGLAEVPAIVDETLDEQGRYLAALSENLDRADMTPLAEARALRHLRVDLKMKQADAAKAMRMSERGARDREKLLDMPTDVGEALSGREIPLEAIPHFAAIAKACPNAAQGIVARAREGSFPYSVSSASDLKSATAVARMLADVAEKAGMVKVVPAGYYNGGVNFNKLPLEAEDRKRLKPIWEEIPPSPYGGARVGFKFDEKDGKAAAKAGALLEFEGDSYITDPKLIAELAEKKLPVMAKAAKEAQKKAKSRGDVGQSAEDRKKQEEREARKRKREEEMFAGANKELGDRLNALSNPKATDLEIVRLICSMALGDEPIDLVDKGLGVLDPDTYATREDDDPSGGDPERWADQVVLDELAAAKNAGECYRIVLRAVLARRHTLAPKPTYHEWVPIPGAERDDVLAGLDEVAEKLGILPKLAQERVAERRKKREKEAKERAEREAEEAKQLEKAKAAADKALKLIEKKPGQSTPDIAQILHVRGDLLLSILRDFEKDGRIRRDDDRNWHPAAGKDDSAQVSGAAKGGTRAERAIALIAANPGITAPDIAKAMKLKPNYLYGILGRLEKEGKIEKEGREYTVVDAT